MEKRLYRSRTNKVIAGVLGGIGEYYDTDPVIIRLVYLLATFATGIVPGILAYLVAMLIVPVAPPFVPSTPASAEAVHDTETV
ncbi:MAG: Stress-responsive transcriptional regulator [Parcubacteria bacterium C7867-004]|nr:MAG: Stress-responsive transcriptional regulator [Parcubacteria bacterium C7867-004]